MTSSSSSLLRFVVDGFDVLNRLVLFPHLLSARCQGHHYPASRAAREGSFLAACSTRAREPWELSAAIHAPFQELQPVHLPFDWTSTPRQCQSCQHRCFVLLDSFGKRLQLG